MLELEVIDDPAAAALTLDPIRARLLAALVEPGSAASLAGQVGLTRQKVNYHLRLLEEHGLVEQVDERHWGGIRERMMVATAASYIVSPGALGPIGADPGRSSDRLSASYLVALAGRIIGEVGELWRRARKSDKRLATLSIDTVIHFRTPTDRAEFTRELTRCLGALTARYHEESPGESRPHRLIIASYPAPDDNR